MDRSVDSIGTCSLDVEASAELSDWSTPENNSAGTLRSVSLKSPGVPPESLRLPSYLSLACTVNGYSQITNYDPDRLAKSRDNSPHRPNNDQQQQLTTYAIHNNLLSPPNVVPLPMQKNMNEQTISQHHHRQFYSSKKMTFISKECNYNIIDTVDTCIESSKFRNGQLDACNKSNGSDKINSSEPKSFIQQRVERLYGPGALAQGFFVNTRGQRNHKSESESSPRRDKVVDKPNKSMQDQLLVDKDDDGDSTMKQSASSPSLPVLRHLTPEFRAQLPTFSPRKGVDSVTMQKSTTLPQLKEEMKINGHHHQEAPKVVISSVDATVTQAKNVTNKSPAAATVKDGHYFLQILDNESKRLLALADQADKELLEKEQDLSENAKGFLRAAAGKGRLLVSQKMQQFKGLCTNNLTQVEGEAFPTTNEDLQGFWDMVMLQVDEVDALFRELDTLRANDWNEIVKKPCDSSNGRTSNGKSRSKTAMVQKSPVSAASNEARAKREALRKQIIEDRRKAMKESKNKATDAIEIYAPETS